jgi:hypothetical protein
MNAVVDALAPLGITHLDMPYTAERVWAAIQGARPHPDPLPGGEGERHALTSMLSQGERGAEVLSPRSFFVGGEAAKPTAELTAVCSVIER